MIIVVFLTDWPIATGVCVLKKSIALLEEKMLVNETLLGLFVHSLEWVILPSKFAVQALQRLRNLGSRKYTRQILFAHPQNPPSTTALSLHSASIAPSPQSHEATYT